MDISQVGVGAGLEEKLFQPADEMKKDFYAELPIKIRLTGSYHQMGEFVSGIAALPRIVTLHDITIKPDDKDSTTCLSFELTAKTFRYLDDAEVAAEKSKAEPAEKGKKSKSKGQGRRSQVGISRLTAKTQVIDMFSKSKNSWLLVAGVVRPREHALTACSSKDDELEQFIADTKKEPGGRVEPLPELKPYEIVCLRVVEPCARRSCRVVPAGPSPLRPDSRRNREFLEQFSLDTLRMVGTLRMADRTYGLDKDKRRPRPSRAARKLHGAGRWQGHRNIAFED